MKHWMRKLFGLDWDTGWLGSKGDRLRFPPDTEKHINYGDNGSFDSARVVLTISECVPRTESYGNLDRETLVKRLIAVVDIKAADFDSKRHCDNRDGSFEWPLSVEGHKVTAVESHYYVMGRYSFTEHDEERYREFEKNNGISQYL